MMNKTNLKAPNLFLGMPKIDLHRHLEGSLRINTLQEIAGRYFPEIAPALHGDVQIQTNDPTTPENFLSKFRALRKFYQSKELIQRFVSECVEDAAADGMVYLELRFSPAALTQSRPELLSDVISLVIQSATVASLQFDLPLGLIVCLNRHESVEFGERIINCALPFRSERLVGIDLTGDEQHFSALPFQGLLHKAKDSGMAITVHAGEWGGASNIEEAIVKLAADRIGHGVRILDDQNVLLLARERKIPFEVCLTSNVQSGIFAKMENHPINKMAAAGLNVTINSDDPQISKITLSSELEHLAGTFGFNLEQIQKLMLAAIDAAFLFESEKAKVRSIFLMRFDVWRRQVTI